MLYRKTKGIIWLFIILSSLLVIGFQMIIEYEGKPYYFPWTLNLIPIIVYVIHYPNWRGMMIGFSFMFGISFMLYSSSASCLLEMGAAVVNLCIMTLITYYRIQSKSYEEKLKELSVVDALTGVYNRRYFYKYASKAIPFAKDSNIPLHLLMLDVDYFKSVNDTYGHNCGDVVLKGIARIIQSQIRESDMLCRLGGEEFGVITMNTSDHYALSIAERIRCAVESHSFVYQEECIQVTISIGVSKFDPSDTLVQWAEKADVALYQAKSSGRNQIVHH
jgi:diguanylate cyclase (GGDEF)-like protein